MSWVLASRPRARGRGEGPGLGGGHLQVLSAWPGAAIRSMTGRFREVVIHMCVAGVGSS